MYKRIVVPLDGSDLAERAVPFAEEMARLMGAPIHLVRVIDTTGLAAGAYGLAIEYGAWQEVMADEEEAARDYLASVRQRVVNGGLMATSELPKGPVASTLVAALRPGDLVVMTSHGRSGVARWFLGSVAEAVMRRSPVPVMLVRAGMAAQPLDRAIPMGHVALGYEPW